MKSFKIVSALASLMLAVGLLAACGDPTATTVPATKAAATTSAVTTAAPVTTVATTVAATTAAQTTVAATTVVQTTAAATTAKVATTTPAATMAVASGPLQVPADGKLTGDLALLGKVLEATNEFKSIKMTVKSEEAKIDGTFVIIKPDKINFQLINGDQKQYFIAVGSEVYTSSDGKAWAKAPAGAVNVQSIIGGLNQGSIEQVKKLAGGTFMVKPDEKLDGKAVGVMQIDSSTATTADGAALQGAMLTYKYDKQSNRLVQVVIKSSLYEIDTRYLDYDSANNKVEAPAL